jgi:hypothetical protein
MSAPPSTQVVRPAGAGSETIFVLILCGVILIASAAVVALRTVPTTTAAIAAWQIDARTDLTAAEQGINADLRVAADDLTAAPEDGRIAEPEELAAEDLPPFAKDATTDARGGHIWKTVGKTDGFAGWFGRSAFPDIAGSLLLRIVADGNTAPSDARTSVWLNRSQDAAIGDLSNEALIASGWQEITSRFDASVTRDPHP